MQLRRKFKTFVAMRSGDRRLVFEAMALLALARLIVLTVRLRFMAPWLSRAPDTVACDEELLLRVGKAVTRAARNVPWNAVCLPQAMAAKAMLARRGCGSSFHFGATIVEGGKIDAHAWLIVGETVVVGADGMQGISPLARFG